MTWKEFTERLELFGLLSYIGGVLAALLTLTFSDLLPTFVAGIVLGIAAVLVNMWHTKRFIRRLDATRPALHLPERTP
jgi:hypothetical protein